MDSAAKPDQSEGASERQAQKELTGRVGVTLTRRTKADNRKLGSWKSRFGLRREARP
jgi:hypothetical protein